MTTETPVRMHWKHYLSATVCVGWALWVLLDYLVHHPYTTNAILSIPYAGLLGCYGLLALAGGGWVVYRRRKLAVETLAVTFRGGSVYLLVWLFGAAALLAFSTNAFVPEVGAGLRTGYFALTAVGYALGLLLLATVVYVLGDGLLRPLGYAPSGGRRLVAIALGFSLLGFVLVILGLFNALHPYLLWPLLALSLGLRYQAAARFLSATLWQKHELTVRYWWEPAAWVLLFAVLGVNFVAAFKAFPIGYDGSALYVNLAGLIADSAGLPYGGQAFNWSVMMSLGEMLFGRLTMTILLSHGMSFLCILLLYRLARLWLPPSFALLAILVPLVSPYFGFHAFIDEKVDLAFTFIVLASFYLAAEQLWARPQVQSKLEERGAPTVSLFRGRWQPDRSVYLGLLLGGMAGYAFGIKYTAILYVLALGGWAFYLHGGKRAFFAAAAGAIGLVFAGGIYRYSYLEIDRGAGLLLGLTVLALSLFLFVRAYRGRWRQLLAPGRQLAALTLAAGLAFAPWAWKNGSEHGSLAPDHLLEGKAIGPALDFIPSLSLRQPPPGFSPRLTNLRTTDQRPRFRFAAQTQDGGVARNASADGAREEIQRYLGFEAPFWRYVSLPYDLTVNTNIPNARHLDLSFLFLLFLPLLLLFRPGEGRPAWQTLLLVPGLFVYLAGTYYSVYAQPGENYYADQVLEQITLELTNRSTGQLTWHQSLYVTLLFPVLWMGEALAVTFAVLGAQPTWAVVLEMTAAFGLLYYATRARITAAPVAFRALAGVLALYGLLWWVLGSGIIWYAMPLFVLFPVVLLYFFAEPGRFLGPALQRFSAVFAGVAIGCFLLVQTLLYFTSAYPGDATQEGLFRWPFVDVVSNPRAQSDRALSQFNPVASEAITYINARPEAKVYRVNTPYGHFIEHNDVRVFSDPVLEAYDRIASRLDEPDRFFDMLYAQGYRFILFDLRTGSLDQTPEKNLFRKFASIARILTESDKVHLLTTDNIVADPSAPVLRLTNGQRLNARRGIHGQTVQLGYLALFEVTPPGSSND